MHNNNNLKTEFGGEIGERYKIIRNCRYGNNLNVYKAHKVVNNKSRIPYVVKCYDTIEAFKIESQMLKMLKDVKNIMQMIDIYPQQSIIICECALYDLETFLGHQDYGQRHKEKDEIDIVSGLSELQKHNIVHTELSPKNIMYFKNKDDCDERWKLIDFDSACIVDKDDVKIITNYSAPEIIRSHENKTEIKANFAMDMFSFGLVLYFLETGHHYWDGENEIMKEELISTKHLIIDVQDPTACFIIKELLSKTILSRMSLQKFVQSTYYTGETETAVLEEPMNLDSNYISGMSEEEYRLYRAFKPFFESYHNEMKKNLEEMGSKIDNCTDAVKDLTKKIPQWLVKVKNEKVPRVFVIFPDEKDWKKPTTWMLAKPFRLLFVCEHKDQWHLPKQKGYKVLKIPQFIKKYGPWINLCLKVLSSAVGIMASNLFADGVADFLSTIFNLADNSDIIQHIQEIIDTVDSGVKTICDELPNFNPLNNESNTPYKIINESGLRELKNFLDTQENAGHFGGLVQCVEEETGEILWLCEEHRDGYSVKRTDPVVSDSPPTSPRECPPRVLSRPHPTRLKNINKQLPKLPLPTSPVFPVSPVSPASSTDTLFVEADGDGKKLYLDPTQQLENICQILFEVIDNADASRRRHFRTDDIREIAQKMRGHVNSFRLLSPIWYDEIQKVKFISILENQQYMYIHFLRSIVRYCIVKHDSTVGSKTMQASFLYNDLFEIRSIIKAGKSFNEHLSKLIETLKLSRSDIHKNSAIQIALDSFANEPQLKVNVYDNLNIISDKVLSKWYHIANQTFIETPTETENQGELFNTTPRFLDDKIVAGKSLKNLNNNETFSCIEKEIYLYHEHNLNNNDFIIKFHGYSVSNCKPVLFYDYAEHGDLYTYIQVNHDSSRNLLKDWGKKIKLAWEITQGVKFLHNQKILHLDLRSANILLKEDEMGELIPTISNFLWSRDTCDNKTFVYLHKNNQEKMPELPKEYQRWENIVKKMCHLKAEERCNIGSVEIIMGKLYKRRSESQSSVSTLQSFKSEQLPQFSISQFKDTET
ncbi:19577_t:CDS:10 [Rhizophagus irregularis]|nr:19577_t:CDS:10 [Rhizophagus irregularis]